MPSLRAGILLIVAASLLLAATAPAAAQPHKLWIQPGSGTAAVHPTPGDGHYAGGMGPNIHEEPAFHCLGFEMGPRSAHEIIHLSAGTRQRVEGGVLESDRRAPHEGGLLDPSQQPRLVLYLRSLTQDGIGPPGTPQQGVSVRLDVDLLVGDSDENNLARESADAYGGLVLAHGFVEGGHLVEGERGRGLYRYDVNLTYTEAEFLDRSPDGLLVTTPEQALYLNVSAQMDADVCTEEGDIVQVANVWMESQPGFRPWFSLAGRSIADVRPHVDLSGPEAHIKIDVLNTSYGPMEVVALPMTVTDADHGWETTVGPFKWDPYGFRAWHEGVRRVEYLIQDARPDDHLDVRIENVVGQELWSFEGTLAELMELAGTPLPPQDPPARDAPVPVVPLLVASLLGLAGMASRINAAGARGRDGATCGHRAPKGH